MSQLENANHHSLIAWYGWVLLYIHRNRRLIRDRSPGRPPRLSHSSCTLMHGIIISGFLGVGWVGVSFFLLHFEWDNMKVKTSTALWHSISVSFSYFCLSGGEEPGVPEGNVTCGPAKGQPHRRPGGRSQTGMSFVWSKKFSVGWGGGGGGG